MRRFAKVFEFEADEVLVRLDTDDQDELVIVLTVWTDDDEFHNMTIKPLNKDRGYDGELTYQLFQSFSKEQVLEALEFFEVELCKISPTE